VGKAALLVLNTFACVALAALGAFAILKISFGA
jgi:succinate dehydrogenase hydrophobic anchor subunit